MFWTGFFVAMGLANTVVILRAIVRYVSTAE